VARRGGGGGTASATAAVGNNVPRASRSAAAAFFARMDVRRAAVTMAGAAMLSRWRLRAQMLDGAARGGGAGDAKRRCRYGGRRRWMGSSPAADGDGCGDAAVPSDQRRRQLRLRRDERGGGATTRDKRQATAAHQGAMLRSSRHGGGEVW
jgi:hypothetical protein